MHTAHEKIRELRSLHEEGLLSQQEFDSRKNAILDAEYALPDARGIQVPGRPGTELGLMAGMEVGPPDRRSAGPGGDAREPARSRGEPPPPHADDGPESSRTRCSASASWW